LSPRGLSSGRAAQVLASSDSGSTLPVGNLWL
jgi:hypothetical protein